MLGRVSDDRDDDGRDEELGQVRLVGEGLDRADEDLGDERGDDGRDAEDAEGDSERPPAHLSSLVGTCSARCRRSDHHVTPR